MTLVFRRFPRFAVYFCHLVPKSHCDIIHTGPVPCSDTCNDCLPLIYNALRYELVRNQRLAQTNDYGECNDTMAYA